MRAAVLGGGRMGEGVVRYLKQCPEVQGIIVYDPCVEPLLMKIKENEGVEITACLEDVLSDSGVRVVFITAVNEAHKELALKSLAVGKAVMCEKPMANTLHEAYEMVQAAENRFLQIGFELRYSKLYSIVKRWIEKGLLGNTINTNCYYSASAFNKGLWCATNQSGGMFAHKLSRYVDLPRWWIGDEVCEVYSACAPNIIPYYEVRDNFHTICRYRNGAVSSLSFVMSHAATFGGDPTGDVVSQQQGDGHELRYIITGTKGAIETDVFARTIKRWKFGDTPKCFTSELIEALTWTGAEEHEYCHNIYGQTRDVIRRVSQGLPPSISPMDAYETMRVCIAAEESARTGVPVFIG